MTLLIGAIGYRGHAARIIEFIESSGMAEVRMIYHPTADVPGRAVTRRLDDLGGCDAIFILSPNRTHAAYLARFARAYPGYVFCEKPPVVVIEDLRAIRNSPERTYFNFNLRRSELARVIEARLASGFFGRVLRADAALTHGLAFKPEYPGSWRADIARHPLGVTETVSVHFLDYFMALFGKPSEITHRASNQSGCGTAADTSALTCAHESGVLSTIFASYAAPFGYDVRITGTNGLLTYDGESILLRGPRDCFSETGSFVCPPVVEELSAPLEVLWNRSLEKSVRLFLEHCRDRTPFPAAWFRDALATNEVLLSLEPGPVTQQGRARP